MAAIDTGTDDLLADLTDRVLTITLNRPEARNALSPALTTAFRQTLKDYGDHPDVGALVVTGAGGAFCAGGDVKAMASRGANDQSLEERFQETRARHHETAGTIHQLRIPSIAALPGPAAGAGLAIALSCDIRLAADSAFLATGYARIGLSGDYGIAWLLTRAVGPSRARALLLTAERIEAERAAAIGLVHTVHGPDELADAAQDLAVRLANGPRLAYSYIKDNLDEALVIDHATAIDHEAERLIRTQSTQDHKEAARAFVERRDPVFTGQ